MVALPPRPTFVMVPRPTAVAGQGEIKYPPSYNSTFGVTAAMRPMPVGGPGSGPNMNYTYQQYQPPAGYSSSGNDFQDPVASYGQKSGPGVPAP